VDEIIIKFKGRTGQKIIIPGKPIPTGFKIFALGDSDYTYNWECTRPSLAEGLIAAKKYISLSILNSDLSTFLNPTQSVVIRLIKYLSIYVEKGLSFYLFLDNLFVCWKSAIALKERGIAVTGTVRKGASGYPPRLLQLKKVNRGLIWGSLQAFIIRGVCCWLWQDSNAVIGKFSFFSPSFLFFLIEFMLFSSFKDTILKRKKRALFSFILKFKRKFIEREKNVYFFFIFYLNFLNFF
jgi:Transposase IS4